MVDSPDNEAVHPNRMKSIATGTNSSAAEPQDISVKLLLIRHLLPFTVAFSMGWISVSTATPKQRKQKTLR
jgi:hypothetical protein